MVVTRDILRGNGLEVTGLGVSTLLVVARVVAVMVVALFTTVPSPESSASANSLVKSVVEKC